MNPTFLAHVLGATALAVFCAGTGFAADEHAIARVGAFYVGGEILPVSHNAPFVRPVGPPRMMAGQAYVEFFLPHGAEGTKKKTPLVLIPGLGLSASLFLMAPPGGESWVNYFVAAGYPVYLFYRPGEGAAGFWSDDVNAAIAGEKVEGLTPISRMGDIAHGGASRPDAYDHFYDDQQFPKDAEFARQLLATGIPQGAAGPASKSYRGPAAMNDDGGTIATGPSSPHYDSGAKALIALLEKIGPSIVLGHSLGGPVVYNTAAARPDLFRLAGGMEPASCPVSQTEKLKSVPFLHMEGDRPAEFYRDDPQRLAKTKALFAQCDAMVDEIRKKGGRAGALYLSEAGETGNSHYFMIDSNNMRVAKALKDAMEALLR